MPLDILLRACLFHSSLLSITNIMPGFNQAALATMTSQITAHRLVVLIELLLGIITFSLFCSAYPDQYRTKLWHIGGEHGWNSDPSLRIYFYANYKDPPEIPLIWSQRSVSCSNNIYISWTINSNSANGSISFFSSLLFSFGKYLLITQDLLGWLMPTWPYLFLPLQYAFNEWFFCVSITNMFSWEQYSISWFWASGSIAPMLKHQATSRTQHTPAYVHGI